MIISIEPFLHKGLESVKTHKTHSLLRILCHIIAIIIWRPILDLVETNFFVYFFFKSIFASILEFDMSLGNLQFYRTVYKLPWKISKYTNKILFPPTGPGHTVTWWVRHSLSISRALCFIPRRTWIGKVGSCLLVLCSFHCRVQLVYTDFLHHLNYTSFCHMYNVLKATLNTNQSINPKGTRWASTL